MSGGHWDYKNEQLCCAIFNSYDLSCKGQDSDLESQRRKARVINPLEDKLMSELLYDVFKILHDYDWYISGDSSQDKYRESVHIFKKKWLNRNPELVQKIIDEEVDSLRSELYSSFGLENKEIDKI